MSDKIQFGDNERDDLNLVRQVVLRRLREELQWSQADSQATFDSPNIPDYGNYVTFASADHKKSFLALSQIVFWELVTAGIVVPGIGGGGSAQDWGLPHFRRTEYGKKVIEAGRIVPHDPTGYLAEVTQIAKICADEVTLSYIREALQCFTRNCCAAAALLLGVASEASFLVLCRIISSSLSDVNARSKFDKMRVKEKHRWIVARYEQLPANIRSTLPDGLDTSLIGIYDLIRRQRNELGHPQLTSPAIKKDDAFAAFQLFLIFLRDAEKFAEFCQTHPF